MSIGPLFLPATPADVESVAVGIELRGHPKRFPHAAILFRRSDRSLHVLEMYLEGSIGESDDSRANDFAWAVPQIAKDQLENIAAFCETIADRTPRLRYAFRLLADSVLVEKGNAIELRGSSVGATCATFVLIVFQSRGRALIQLEPWEVRPRDPDWQRLMSKDIFDDPVRFGYGLQDLKQLKDELSSPCMRYMPQDVLAACIVGGHPSKFAEIDPEASRSWASMKSLWDVRQRKGWLPPH